MGVPTKGRAASSLKSGGDGHRPSLHNRSAEGATHPSLGHRPRIQGLPPRRSAEGAIQILEGRPPWRPYQGAAIFNRRLTKGRDSARPSNFRYATVD